MDPSALFCFCLAHARGARTANYAPDPAIITHCNLSLTCFRFYDDCFRGLSEIFKRGEFRYIMDRVLFNLTNVHNILDRARRPQENWHGHITDTALSPYRATANTLWAMHQMGDATQNEKKCIL